MKVQLKGINSATKTLANGREVVYWYAWRGGPRLKGEPGSLEFAASYNAAIAVRPRASGTLTLSGLCDKFQDSGEFRKLAPRTQRDYRGLIKMIEAEHGDAPVNEFGHRKARTVFLDWRDQLAKRSPRQADYAWTVLARVIAWGVDRGHAEHNPCLKGGRLYSETRADKVWTDEDEANLRRHASPALQLALTLALWTGQRQGDLLRLTWFNYDGRCIRLQQGKTKVRVVIPAGAPLKTALDKAKQDAPRDQKILRNIAGEDWTSDGFRASWGKACRRAGIAGITFHDLRGTAVLRLCLAGCSVAEIATITGHALGDVQSILDSNYFSRDLALAESGISKLEAARAKLETGTDLQTEDQTVPDVSHNVTENTK